MNTSTMTMRVVAGLVLAATFSATPEIAVAQGGGALAQRIASAPDGKVRFTFATRPDVCGNGNSISTHDDSSADVVWAGCQHGPARMVLQVQNHQVTKLHTYVGGEWRSDASATDLGDVAPQQAVDYLISLARSGSAGGREAIFPTTIANGVTVWPQLLQIARDDHASTSTRRDAVFWLGQAAGKAATADLVNLADTDTLDRAIREQAVFALSQQHNENAVSQLIHIAQTNRDPAIRKRAIFWLGQSNDPRALALFENLLTKPAR